MTTGPRAASDPAGLPADATAHGRGSSEPAGWSSGHRHRRGAAVEAGLVLTSMATTAGPLGICRSTRRRSRAQQRRPRGGAGVGQAVPGAYVAGWIKRGPTDSSVPTSRARAKPSATGRRFKPDGSAIRSASHRRWTNSCWPGSPKLLTPPAGVPSTPPRWPGASAVTGPATSSPRSPTCWPWWPPPAPPLRRRLADRLRELAELA